MLLTDYCKNNNKEYILKSWNKKLNFKNYKTITHGSHYKAYWNCFKNKKHIWQAEVYNRIKKDCPYCSNRLIHSENSLENAYENNPLLKEYWDYSSNKKQPKDIIAKTQTKYNLKCPKCKTKWKNKPLTPSCPVCSNRKLKTGFNDFKTKYPQHLKDWSTKNIISPEKYLPRNKDLIFWTCEKQHEWSTKLDQKVTLKVKCHYCTNQKLLTGYNDFWTKHPALHSEWDYKRNKENNIDPTQIFSNSAIKASWICEKENHSWTASIASRAKGSQCRYCTGKEIIIGINDLKSQKPILAKNIIKYNPEKLFKNSTKIIKIKCNTCKVIFQDKPHNLILPLCEKCRKNISQEEESFYKDLKSITSYKIKRNYKIKNNMELDFYIEDKSIALEYNGDYWHSNKILLKNTEMTSEERHFIKKDFCEKDNIKLLFVWSSDYLKNKKYILEEIRKVLNSNDKDTKINPIFNVLSKD